MTEVPIICIEIEATVLPTKGEPGPEEMSFILKSHKKSSLLTLIFHLRDILPRVQPSEASVTVVGTNRPVPYAENGSI